MIALSDLRALLFVCPMLGSPLNSHSLAGPSQNMAGVDADQEEDPRENSPSVRRVAFLLFSGVEILDLAGPLEVFSAAGGEDGRFEMYLVAETAAPVSTQGGLRMLPTHTFDNCPAPDVLIVPGGRLPLGRQPVREWLQNVVPGTEVTLSVCTGAFLLSRAGLLEGLAATTHRSSIETLKLAVPTGDIRDDRRFVDSGQIVTSAGVSAGIDGALHVVKRLLGVAVANRVVLGMQYQWDSSGMEPLAAHDGTPTYSLLRTTQLEGVEAGIDFWHAMAEPPSEQAVNQKGYLALSRAADPATALPIFELNALRFPHSANAMDGLGDVYELMGERELSIVSTRKCLKILEETPGMDARTLSALVASCAGRIERLNR